MTDFVGAKIALFTEDDKLIVILRDNKPGLIFAGMWDFPGGAREGSETPQECVVRETKEEVGITLDPAVIAGVREYPSMSEPPKRAYFMAAHVTPVQVQSIIFGDEGQMWKLMTVDEFLAEQNAIEFLKDRLRDYLAGSKPGTAA